jgi:hypothetical protein
MNDLKCQTREINSAERNDANEANLMGVKCYLSDCKLTVAIKDAFVTPDQVSLLTFATV